MKMVSMKKKPMSKRRLREMKSNVAAEVEEPSYPWGLELSLEDEAIKKLGIDMENTMAGDTVTIVAKANVTSLSRRQNMNSGKNKTNDSISLQITDMAYGVSMK